VSEGPLTIGIVQGACESVVSIALVQHGDSDVIATFQLVNQINTCLTLVFSSLSGVGKNQALLVLCSSDTIMDQQKNDACEFQQSQSIGSVGEFKLSKNCWYCVLGTASC
jgi:hypothetical protein